MGISRTENTISEIKNCGMSLRREITEEWVSLRSIEIIQKKREKLNRNLWYSVKGSKICDLRIPGEEKELATKENNWRDNGWKLKFNKSHKFRDLRNSMNFKKYQFKGNYA